MNIGSSYYTTTLQNQFSQLQNSLAKAQQEISTGKKFVEASDDPSAARATQKISLERLSLAGDESRRSLAMRLNDTALLTSEQVTSLLNEASSAIELAFENDPSSSESIQLGLGIDSLVDQAVSFLNTQMDGRYLFGGNETAQPPFQLLDDGTVSYEGGDESLSFEIGLGVRMDPTSDPATNSSWATWMNDLLAAKEAFLSGDRSGAKDALDAASFSAENAFASMADVVGKSLRLQTIEEWSMETDTRLANQEATLQEIDPNVAILNFNELQRSYQASMQSGQLLLSLSLVNFL
jgi:flagellar hook-associated protein 3 FlgL